MPRNPDPHSRGFDTAPKPEGWQGGSDDFSFLGFGGGPGRLGINFEVEQGEYDPRGYHRRQNADECRHLFDEPIPPHGMSPDSSVAYD